MLNLCLLNLCLVVVLQLPIWRNYIIECLRNFQSYLIPPLILFLVYIIFKLSKFGAARSFTYIIAISFALIVLFKPLAIYFERSYGILPESGLENLKVFYANLNLENNQYQKTLNQIQKENPDIVGLVEVNKTWLKNLRLKVLYPYYLELPSENKFGIALYSKYPFQTELQNSLGDNLPRVILASVNLKAKKVLVALTHAIPPLNSEAYHRDRLLFRRLATFLRNQAGNIVLMGDFNGTVYSYFYNILVDGADLKDAAVGSGYQKTWNLNDPFMYLVIDHILYRGDLTSLDFKRGTDIGSDHIPLIASFG